VLERALARGKRRLSAHDPHLSASEVLGVPVDASPETVRRAYLELIQVWHPDRFAKDSVGLREAEVVAKRINDAYRALRRRRGAPRRVWRRPESGSPHTSHARATGYVPTESARARRNVPAWLKQVGIVLLTLGMSLLALALLVYVLIVWDTMY
jgi:preprotein translocase subunit Sec63